MRKLLLVLAAVIIMLVGAPRASAQTTIVTGTVKDANGNPYANGTATAFLAVPVGQPTPSGARLSTTIPTNASGTFAFTGTTALASPQSYIFTLCAPPLNIGPTTNPTPTQVCFSAGPTAVSGASLDIGTALSAVAVQLGPVTGSASVVVNGAGTNPLGASLNVKAAPYNARGDTQSSDNATISGNTTLTCSDCNFTLADTTTNKTFSCAFLFATSMAPSTAVTFVNATTVTIPSSGNGPCTVTWGKDDGAAIQSAMNDFKTAIMATTVGGNIGVLGSPNPPSLYFPCGNYSSTIPLNPSPATAVSGGFIQGCGKDSTKITFLTNTSSAANLFVINSNTGAFTLKGMTFDGVNGTQPGAGAALFLNGTNKADDIRVQRFSTGGPGVYIGNRIDSVGLDSISNNGVGILCLFCKGAIRGMFTSNNFTFSNLTVQGVTGSTAGEGLVIEDSFADECSNAVGCTQFIDSQDVRLIGYRALGGGSAARCAFVDANSVVSWNGGICATFGSDNNAGGLNIAAGGMLEASDVRFISSGTATCIANSGSLRDNGGNSCESAFVIVSGTSTGTTAVLTLSNTGAAVNANCSVGDSLLVEGTGIAGYSGYFPFGITAVSATTLTYLTQGSNLGVLTAGGVAHCRNLQKYSGTLPTALLNNPVPNTCYVTITPIVNATNYLLCNFRTQTATNITRITASSQNVTACATAPIITISDGAVSQTLTLTTAKNSWDSAVDASSGVGTTIFKPNGTITVRYDAAAASACATPPTQLSVSYNISPILSN